MIVSSPERVQQQLADMEESLEREKRHVERIEHEHRQVQMEMEALQEVFGKLQELLKAFEDADVQVSKCKQSRDLVQKQRSELHENEQNLEALNQEELRLNRQIVAAEERIQRVRSQLQSRLTDTEQEYASFQEELEAAVRERHEADQVAQRNQLLVQQIHEQMQDLKRGHQERMCLLREQYTELEQAVQTYHQRLFEVMQKWPKACDRAGLDP
jgi:kinetochore protein Nuf2